MSGRVTTLDPTIRGLKVRAHRSHRARGRVTTLDPTIRGLKVTSMPTLPLVAITVTTLDPTIRGLKVSIP